MVSIPLSILELKILLFLFGNFNLNEVVFVNKSIVMCAEGIYILGEGRSEFR